KKMPNCSRRMLSLQLNELEKDKIIEKKIYPVIPPKTEYRMTRFGETLTPIILEMDKWGQTYNSINSEDSN
ncbi:winged helix-turn-helix transcriptional regulator, partial [Lactobacillus salivarius]